MLVGRGFSTFSHRIHVLPSPADDGYSGKSLLFSRLLPCSVTDVKDYNLISEIVHGIENQKRISDRRHHSDPFLIGGMAHKRHLSDQGSDSLDSLDYSNGGGLIALIDVSKDFVELSKGSVRIADVHAR
jgi:hypothetical protein